MANIWENAVLTTKGIALMSKLIKGERLTFTKCVSGSEKVGTATLQTQTKVSGIMQVLTMQPVTRNSDDSVNLNVLLTNETLVDGYTLWQVGFYAKDPDAGEILFAITQATNQSGGKIIPSKAEMPGYSVEWNFIFNVSGSVDVYVNIDQTGLVTQGALEVVKELAAVAQEAADSHRRDTGNVHNLTKSNIGLGNVDNTADSEKWIDGGFFTEADSDPIFIHNFTSSAHGNMMADGGKCAIIGNVITTIEEHANDENAHPNIILDGNIK